MKREEPGRVSNVFLFCRCRNSGRREFEALRCIFFSCDTCVCFFCRRRRRRCCRRRRWSTTIQNRQTDRHLVARSSAHTGTLPGLHVPPAIPDSPIQVCMNHDPARYIHKVPIHHSCNTPHYGVFSLGVHTYIRTHIHTLPDTVR